MKIYNAHDNPALLKSKIKQYLNKSEYDDYCYGTPFFYSCILSDESNYSNIDFVLEDELKGVLLKTVSSGVDFVKPIGDFKENDFRFLSQVYPNCVFIADSVLSNKIQDCYEFANFKSSNGEETYQPNEHSSFLLPLSLGKDFLRDKIEERIIPKFDRSKLVIEDKLGKDIRKEIIDSYRDVPFFNGFSTDENGHYALSGFHYLTLSEVDMKQKLLGCKLGTQIIGTIKHGYYDSTYGSIPHQGLAYIDVNKHYRGMGIAKLMIQELDKYLDKDTPLFLTPESELGKVCHMEDLFLKHIRSTDCVPYDKQYGYCKHIRQEDREDRVDYEYE